MTKPPAALVVARLATIAVGLALWFLTQSLLGGRPDIPGSDAAGSVLSGCDSVHALTADWHGWFVEHSPWADRLLIGSSLLIDVLALFLICRAVLGRTLRPFVGLVLLFALRQLSQAMCALPAPDGMIWRDPGFPSLLVTYDVANDFFFSGHTAIAVYGAIELCRLGRRWWLPAVGIALFEATTVLVLRAHYTMDVFTGAVTALWIGILAARLSPAIDCSLLRITGSVSREGKRGRDRHRERTEIAR